MQPKMPEWCQKRITSIELKVRFGDGKHRFYLESVCAAPIHGDGRLCNSCQRLQVQTKTQDVRTFPHGFVLDEYSPESHIFDSPWYHSKVEAYGRPSDTDVVLAMEAQRRSRGGKTTKAMKDLIDILVAGAKQDAQEVIVGIPLDAPKHDTNPKGRDVAEPKRGGKEKGKGKTAAKTKASSDSNTGHAPATHTMQTGRVCASFPAHIRFVESIDEPMEVELLTVPLKTLVYNRVEYWQDVASGNVYTKTEKRERGEYIGKWDTARACIDEE
jgi:hypothetical protein